MSWFEAPGTPPDGTWWWAVEDRGHPAFYLRSLMPGDFAPDRLPLVRHVLALDGTQPSFVLCGTCRAQPRSEDLDVVERRTGDRGFLDRYRTGRRPWPRATDPASCWACCGKEPAPHAVTIHGTAARACDGCLPYFKAGGYLPYFKEG